MLYKRISHDGLKVLVEQMLEDCEVIGPKKVGMNAGRKPAHQFLPVGAFEELDLDYQTTEYSAKTYFLPFKEALSTYRFDDRGWGQEIGYRQIPRALIGLHACDINGLLKLDKVFMKEFFPSPYYMSRRKNTFILGIDHDPCEGGFCRSLGTDTVNRGFDLFLTDLGDRYFVAVGSDRGYNAIQRIQSGEVTEQDTQDYLERRRQITEGLKQDVNVQNLPNVMDLEFKSGIWTRWGEKCLSCGTCAMVCPTCYCYGVHEEVSMDFSTGKKIKRLYSCSLLDFALVAGGHNFRPDRPTRLKYRYYHQHRGFVETYGEPKCVGCNRCGRACLSEIDPKEIIRDLQAEVRA